MRVVIVDDSKTILHSLEELLESGELGVTTQAFADPLEALPWCQCHEVDLLLVDYMMPEIDGLEFIRRFRNTKRNAHIPVLVITANSDPEILYAALDTGANDFLTKPLDKLELLGRVRNMLQLRRYQKELSQHAQRLDHEVRRTSVDLRNKENTVARQHQRLMLAQQVASLGSWELDPVTEHITLSSAHGILLGIDATEAQSDLVWKLRSYIGHFVHEDDRFMVRQHMDDAMDKLKRGVFRGDSFEMRIVDNDKQVRLFRAITVPSPPASPEPSTLFGIVQDITLHRQRDEEVRTLSKAVEQSGSTVIVTNTSGDIEYVNPKFCEVTGYNAHEVKGVNPRFLKPDDIPSEHFDQLWQSLAAGRQWYGELQNRRKDGSTYWEIASIFPVTDDRGVVTHYVSIGEDITAQKELEQQLRQLNRTLEQKVETETRKRMEQQTLLLQESRILAMGEMIGAIAHHWRQPLNALGLMIQKVRMDYEIGEISQSSMDEFVQSAMNSIQDMSHVIDEFRELFEQDVHSTSFDLMSSLQSVLKVMKAQLENNYIEVKVPDANPGKFILFGPEHSFQQVLLCVLGNAKDAIVQNQSSDRCIVVTVELDQAADTVLVTVSDTGGGIDPAIMPRIFEPYFTTKNRGSGSGIIAGTGVGLYMSKIIIEERMGGVLQARNHKFGGAEFVISLPASTAPDGRLAWQN
ncbi:response regulator [Desulfurispira natronophila]|uniref:histidine kinase n=1 Tax=Desulfurispira natronophila TaxID=682562 RepID=A0A7W8DG14_9BACT|nr:response regulator [Desulfurispira natronophila]MBB5020733.1 PAS domain S-box-containing protein [Desulfurispira natronophila]